MNLAALLACLSFYSALYLFYFFFMQDQQPVFLIIAIVLILLSIWLTPILMNGAGKDLIRL